MSHFVTGPFPEHTTTTTTTTPHKKDKVVKEDTAAMADEDREDIDEPTT